VYVCVCGLMRVDVCRCVSMGVVDVLIDVLITIGREREKRERERERMN